MTDGEQSMTKPTPSPFSSPPPEADTAQQGEETIITSDKGKENA
jgi:hypothetical protein